MFFQRCIGACLKHRKGRGSSSVHPCEKTFAGVSTTQDIFADIKFVTRSFIFVLMIFPLHKTDTRTEKIQRSLLDITVFSLTVYFILADIYFIFTILWFLPIGFMLSTLITDFCSLMIRLVVLRKQRQIVLTMKRIQRLCVDLHSDQVCSNVRRLPLFLGFLAAFILPTVFIVENIYLFSSDDFLKKYQINLFFGRYINSRTLGYAICIMCEFFTSQQHYSLPGFAAVLCCYIFGLLSRTIDALTVKLNLHRDDFALVFHDYLQYSQKILRCMTQIEDCLSLLLVLTYGYITFSIFNVTTLLAGQSKGRLILETVTTEFISLAVMIAAFLVVSERAARVHDAALRLKSCVHEVSAKAASSDKLRPLLLSLAGDFTSRVVISGCGMILLKRSFIRNMISAIVTYGIILSQLDMDKK